MDKGKRERKSQSSNIAQGLPGKSYHYMEQIDFHLRMALSFLHGTMLLDNFVASNMDWKFRNQSRESALDTLLCFMATYGPDRASFLLPSKLVSRSEIVSFLKQIVDFSTHFEVDPHSFSKFILPLKSSFFDPIPKTIINNLKETLSLLKDIQQILYLNYKNLIIKGLKAQRPFSERKEELESEAFITLVNMIDHYDQSRSKVPFPSYLSYFIKTTKNAIIKGSKHNDLIISSGSEDIEGRIYFSDLIDQDENQPVDERLQIIDMLENTLPRSFFEALQLHFVIASPLNKDEELAVMFQSFDKEETE